MHDISRSAESLLDLPVELRRGLQSTRRRAIGKKPSLAHRMPEDMRVSLKARKRLEDRATRSARDLMVAGSRQRAAARLRALAKLGLVSLSPG